MSKNKYLFPFILVTTLFFLWAFLHNINGILIPHLKKVCQLNDKQSAFIDTAVYVGYFVIAIPAGLFSHRFGYKKGILCGLFLFAAGAFLFIPAASDRNFALFLFALFVAASGATFLETVANPYMTVLGDPATSEQRLNFAQSFNGLGAFVAPLVGTKFILSGVEHTQAELEQMKVSGQLSAYLQTEANSLKLPYLIIGVVLLLVAVAFIFTKLPEVKAPDDAAHGTSFSVKVFRFPHVTWAVVAEFFYVGSQVGVCSFFVRFSKYVANIGEKDAGYLLAYVAMAGFMAGRFIGTFLLRYIKPAQLLSIFASISIALCLIGMSTSGNVAVYAIVATPFFMSIMFPTIFALGVKDLGEETKMAASFLVMSIIGGGIIPLVMGAISDKTGSIQKAYIMPVVCFAFILFFGLKGHKIKTATVNLKNQTA